MDNVTPKNSSSIYQVQIANKFPVDKTKDLRTNTCLPFLYERTSHPGCSNPCYRVRCSRTVRKVQDHQGQPRSVCNN